MAREPIQVGPEEGGRSHVRKEVPASPGPADEDFARMEAIVRTKLSRGDRLTPEESQFLAHLPDRDVRYQ